MKQTKVKMKKIVMFLTFALAVGLFLHTIAFEAQAGGNVYYLTAGDLRNINNDIDYLIITHSDFYSSTELNNLATYRANYDSFNIGIAKVKDIYAQFPNASGDDYSIRDFIQYAYDNWQTAPSYLLLLGDCDLGAVKVPTHMDEKYNCANDDWFGYVSGGDDWADLAIGRMSVRNAGDIGNIKDKIQHYEQDPIVLDDYHQRVLLVNDPSISSIYDTWKRIFNAGYNITKLADGIEYTKDDFLNAFDSNFLYWGGHGTNWGWGPMGWPQPTNLFTFGFDDFDALNNVYETPIIMTTSCDTADIMMPIPSGTPSEPNCFGEAIVNLPQKGAVAYYGATITIVGDTMPITGYTLEDIFDKFEYNLGQAILHGEMRWASGAHQQLLLGDPALHAFGHRLSPTQPDLTLASTDISYEGRTENLSVKVTNLGNAAATNVPVKVLLYETQDIIHTFAEFTVPSIPVKSDVETSLTVAPPLKGEYLVVAKIDPENVVDESFKLNNQNGRRMTTVTYSEVTVLDEYDQPMSGVHVSAHEYQGSMGWGVTTDDQGKARLYLKEGIQVYFGARFTDIIPSSVYTDVVTTPADVTINKPPLPSPTTVTVLNEHGQPISGTHVGVYDLTNAWLGTSSTDEQGKAKFYILEGHQVYFKVQFGDTPPLSHIYSDVVTAPADVTINKPQQISRLTVINTGNLVTFYDLRAYDMNGRELGFGVGCRTGEEVETFDFYIKQGVQFYFVVTIQNSSVHQPDTEYRSSILTAPANATINLLAPITDDQNVTLNEDTSINITLTATDPDNDPLTYTIVAQPTHGTLSGTAPNVTYKPNLNYNGTDSFTFKVNDGTSDSNIATVSLTINPINDLPVLASIGDKSVDEGSLLEFQISATDPDGDTLTYSASNLPTGASFDAVTRTFSWTPTYEQAGTYLNMHFEVTDGSLPDSEDITITVNNVNGAPVLDSIGNKSVDENTLLTFTANATDPDGDTLTYSASNLPTGASFDAGTRTFSWTPTYEQAGIYNNVHFEVSDGTATDSEDITITVNNVNRAPVLDSIGNKSVNEGQTLSFTVSGSDPDGDSLIYSASNLPPGASFDAGTRTFSWTPTYEQAGIYPNVHFEVTDGSLSDSEDITITVNNVNGAPVLEPIGNKWIDENTLLTFTVNAIDPDGDTLTYSASNLPPSANFDAGTRTFSWTPTYEQAGIYPNVHFEVTDGSLSDSEDITITVNNVNGAPVLEPIGNKWIDENTLLTFTVNATDPDGDTLTYSASNLPPSANFDAGTRTFSWTPTYDQAGIYNNVHFEVSDGTATDSEDITITVNNVNRAPVLDSIGNKSVDENTLLTFTANATDPDGDTLTYSASNLPTGASFDAGTRTFSWTPTYDQAGTYPNVHFEVTDGSLSDSEDIAITVNNVNRAPAADDQALSLQEDTSINISLTGSDPDGDSLTYTIVIQPEHGTLSGTAPNVTYKPNLNYNGTDSFTFKVNDGTNDSNIATISLTINPVNDAPELSVPDLITFVVKSADPVTKIYKLQATDPDGDTLSYSATGLPSGATLESNTGKLSWTITLSDIGSYPVTFTVSDGVLQDTKTITVTVTEATDFADKPDKTELKCYNNVFNPLKGEKALIKIELHKQAYVKVSLYNTKGNKIKELADEEKDAGMYKYYWDGRNDSGNIVGSGLYFVHIQAGDYKKTKKIVVIK